MVLVVLLFFLIFYLAPCQGKDLGTVGVLSPIVEQDPIQLIQQKLKSLEDSGELERYQQELAQKAKATVERPKPVSGITRATQPRVFSYDPTYEVKEDIKDPLGRIIHARGTKVNPLETVNLSQELVFIDGNDVDQKTWFFERNQNPGIGHQNDDKVKLILVKGSPLALSEELQMPVYFDQGGVLVKKFGIQHVPALVSQEGLSLRIEEVALPRQKKDRHSLLKQEYSQ